MLKTYEGRVDPGVTLTKAKNFDFGSVQVGRKKDKLNYIFQRRGGQLPKSSHNEEEGVQLTW